MHNAALSYRVYCAQRLHWQVLGWLSTRRMFNIIGGKPQLTLTYLCLSVHWDIFLWTSLNLSKQNILRVLLSQPDISDALWCIDHAHATCAYIKLARIHAHVFDFNVLDCYDSLILIKTKYLLAPKNRHEKSEEHLFSMNEKKKKSLARSKFFQQKYFFGSGLCFRWFFTLQNEF